MRRARAGRLLPAVLLAAAPSAGFAQGGFVERPIDDQFVHGQGASVVDVDGDGDRDVVVALSLTDAVYLYVNGGDSGGGGAGTAWTTVPVAADGTIVAMQTAVADLDGDSDLDVAAVGLFDRDFGFTSAGEVAWYENPGDVLGAWVTHPLDGSFWGARFVAAGDLTGDGRADLVVGAIELADPNGTPMGNGVYWFANGMAGLSGSRVAIDAGLGGVETVLIHDVDGDGVVDVVASGRSSGEIVWYENERTGVDPSPTFARHTLAATPLPNGLAFGDADGDAALELFAAGGAGVSWFDPGADPTLEWTGNGIDATFGTGVTSWPVAGDFDGDGRGDVAVASTEALELRWYHRTAGGSWDPLAIAPGFAGLNYLTGGDLDGDGRPDLVTTTYDADPGTPSDRLDWWQNRMPSYAVFVADAKAASEPPARRRAGIP